jgi:hypothetical protein
MSFPGPLILDPGSLRAPTSFAKLDPAVSAASVSSFFRLAVAERDTRALERNWSLTPNGADYCTVTEPVIPGWRVQ